VLRIDGTAATRVDATPERCLEVLGDVESYPSWSSLIKSVEPVGEDRLRLQAQVLGLSVRMTCTVAVDATRAVLRRVPNGADDEESYEAAWTVTPADGGSAVELHVTAALDAPGPASLLRGRVTRALVDDVVADFRRAV
jgi:ribosome-associated toxin RatA of RatAB toxin-antitoxin module